MKADLQYELDKTRRQELVQVAERERLVNAYATAKPNPVLANVGRQMVKLGERLQGRENDATRDEIVLPTHYSYEAR